MQQFSVKWRPVLVVLGLIGLLFLVMNFNQRMAEYDRLERQLETVRNEATAVMQTQEAMLTEVAYATSVDAVEKWAYEDGRWVRSGENPVIPVPAEHATPTPVPPPTQTVEQLPNWRIWWELFFGDHN
jgi:cell division protein FtsB